MLTVLPNAFGDAATNMAIDAAILETLPAKLSIFRHYGWLEPALTFGYAQKFAAISELNRAECTLCRRMTGGGLVDHRNDWTYTLVLGRSTVPTQMSATELYLKIHEAIQKALSGLGITTTLAPCPRLCDASPKAPGGPSQCFVEPAANDVLHTDGRKIAGAAMRRNRKGLIIQGSINRSALPEAFDYIAFQKALPPAIADALALHLTEIDDIRPLFNSALIEKEKIRFSSPDWTQRR